ncbi:HupE/UreJ family protein [Paenibacillus mucilaginosus]|uniref:HupE/UreJ family protein n=2 Tax=Paenibacillus mucilaginosus TaxID=61624 RepID=UPI00240D71A6|nr:HupE/UreJ family protein [Paenibacillus mucilaginosus]WFA17409.1 HupE/UreJ family protein [Paenibacillus mucilaginosus]
MRAGRNLILLCLSLVVMTVLTVLPAGPASAHAMPSSAVCLDVHEDGVEAELQLPLDRLEVAFGQTLTANPEDVPASYGRELSAYAAERIQPQTPEGEAWTVEVRSLEVQAEEQGSELIVKVWLQPPAGASVEKFTLNYDVIIRELLTHTILVSVRSDWKSGITAADPELIGTIQGKVQSLDVDRSGGSLWTGFQSVVASGMHHIAEGFDHLLFLLVLLLPAPLAVRGGRWDGFAGARHSVMGLLKVVTAFTFGHSFTLIAGALGWIPFPERTVEILIAVSILVSAIHALRPLFPGREVLVAGSFGLVHGMAFAALITELGMTSWQKALSILGFNLGIELMQLFVIAITVPWLILLSLTRAYHPVRTAGAVFAGIAALGWMAERALGTSNKAAALADAAGGHALWLVAALACIAVMGFTGSWFRKNGELKRGAVPSLK